MTPQELAEIKTWESLATSGPWERGVAYVEAPVNPGEGEWASWRDRARVEPDLIWQVRHLPVGQCRLCSESAALREDVRERRVSLYRRLDTGDGKHYVGESTRLVVHHLHRVTGDRENLLEPISSASAQRVVLSVSTEEGEARLVLSEADAAFIAQARDAVPRLVAEIERLQKRVEDLTHRASHPRRPKGGK